MNIEIYLEKNTEIISNLIPLFALLVSLILSIIAIRVSIKANEISKSSYDLLSIFDFLSKEYLDRKFQSIENVKIPGVEKPIQSLRVAKKSAMDSYKEHKSIWQDLTKINSREWENKVAYETSIALERLGFSVFFGALPLRTVLLLASDQILDDYILCHYWIKSYREDKDLTNKNKFDFHRRYGEWIVMLSALWMDKYYPDYESLSDVIKLYEDKQALTNKFVYFTEDEDKNLAEITEKEIIEIFNIKSIKELIKSSAYNTGESKKLILTEGLNKTIT